MFINPALYVFLIATIILLCIVLVAIVLSYIATIRRLNHLESEKESLYKKTLDEQHEAISAAQKKASEIVADATHIKTETEEALNSSISKLSSDFLSAYQTEATKLKNDNINKYSNISKSISDIVTGNLEDLKKIIAQQTIDSQRVVEVKFKEEYQKLEEEMTEYKKERIQKINSNIYEILHNISRIAFGKGISLQEHEELIAKALEESEREIK